jgi:predicted membrane metal-binding protein
MEVLAFMAIFFGAFSIILFLYGTFTVYPLVSILIYLVFPTGAMGFIICGMIILPALIQIHEQSKNILKKQDVT